MGPYKPLRNWVDFPIPYYMEISWELIDPGTFEGKVHSEDGSSQDLNPIVGLKTTPGSSNMAGNSPEPSFGLSPPPSNSYHQVYYIFRYFQQGITLHLYLPVLLGGGTTQDMCQGLNSHYFHIIGDGHQPNSRGLYTQYKDSY